MTKRLLLCYSPSCFLAQIIVLPPLPRETSAHGLYPASAFIGEPLGERVRASAPVPPAATLSGSFSGRSILLILGWPSTFNFRLSTASLSSLPLLPISVPSVSSVVKTPRHFVLPWYLVTRHSPLTPLQSALPRPPSRNSFIIRTYEHPSDLRETKDL